MSDYLYERFLDDRLVYVAARAFWFRQARGVLPHWQALPQYLTERFGDGELFFDGNPIFNAINTSTRKALRIVQESPTEFGDVYISFVVEKKLFWRDARRTESIQERVIVLTLTRESLAKAKQEMRAWLEG